MTRLPALRAAHRAGERRARRCTRWKRSPAPTDWSIADDLTRHHEAHRTWRDPRPRRLRGDPRALPGARHRGEEGAPRGARAERLVRLREPRHRAACRSRRCCAPSASRARPRSSTRSRRTTSSSRATHELSRDGPHRDRREGGAREVPRRGARASSARSRSWSTARGAAGKHDAAREHPDRTTAVHYLKFPLEPSRRARAARRAREERRPRDVVVELVVEHPRYTRARRASRRRSSRASPRICVADDRLRAPGPLRGGRRRGHRLLRRFFNYCHEAMERFFDGLPGGYAGLIMERKHRLPRRARRPPTSRRRSATATSRASTGTVDEARHHVVPLPLRHHRAQGRRRRRDHEPRRTSAPTSRP